MFFGLHRGEGLQGEVSDEEEELLEDDEESEQLSGDTDDGDVQLFPPKQEEGQVQRFCLQVQVGQWGLSEDLEREPFDVSQAH